MRFELRNKSFDRTHFASFLKQRAVETGYSSRVLVGGRGRKHRYMRNNIRNKSSTKASEQYNTFVRYRAEVFFFVAARTVVQHSDSQLSRVQVRIDIFKSQCAVQNQNWKYWSSDQISCVIPYSVFWSTRSMSLPKLTELRIRTQLLVMHELIISDTLYSQNPFGIWKPPTSTVFVVFRSAWNMNTGVVR